MSRKYLLLLIFVIFISISVVSASENSTEDIIASDNDDTPVSLDANADVKTEDYYDDYYEDYDEYDYDYYDKAILKPKKLSTTYDSGKTFKVKVVSAHDKGFGLEDVKIKLRVYTKGSHKDYYAYTDYDGIAEFKLSKLALGTHKVVVSSADSYTNAKKVTSKVTIKKAKTKVSAPKVTAKYKKSKKFKIKVRDKATKKAVKHVKLSVKIGYKTYTLKTNSKGVATFKTKNLKAGSYTVTIKSKNSKYSINGKSKIIIKAVKKKVKKSKSSSSSGGGGYYVGSANSDKFHYPSCSAAKRIKSYNMVSFYSRSEAINAGYVPCGICHP